VSNQLYAPASLPQRQPLNGWLGRPQRRCICFGEEKNLAIAGNRNMIPRLCPDCSPLTVQNIPYCCATITASHNNIHNLTVRFLESNVFRSCDHHQEALPWTLVVEMFTFMFIILKYLPCAICGGLRDNGIYFSASTNNLGHTITTPALLYVRFVTSYYMFRSLVWSSLCRKMQLQKGKMLQKGLTFCTLFPIFTCIFLHEDGNKLNVNIV
jgi:hypothetical protein